MTNTLNSKGSKATRVALGLSVLMLASNMTPVCGMDQELENIIYPI